MNVRKKAKIQLNSSRWVSNRDAASHFSNGLKQLGQVVPIDRTYEKLVTKSLGVKSGSAVPLTLSLMNIRVFKTLSAGVN